MDLPRLVDDEGDKPADDDDTLFLCESNAGVFFLAEGVAVGCGTMQTHMLR